MDTGAITPLTYYAHPNTQSESKMKIIKADDESYDQEENANNELATKATDSVTISDEAQDLLTESENDEKQEDRSTKQDSAEQKAESEKDDPDETSKTATEKSAEKIPLMGGSTTKDDYAKRLEELREKLKEARERLQEAQERLNVVMNEALAKAKNPNLDSTEKLASQKQINTAQKEVAKIEDEVSELLKQINELIKEHLAKEAEKKLRSNTSS
ncbi:hypothetical protein [Desulfovibrio inopinatus]|uniref:hypothetical protein n=1 Tax=Desulfovibrio inopinatus TaxID=102109 RepID=UPI00041B0163|nr:hypothetical protein [Desulfovibrio inopinatus]